MNEAQKQAANLHNWAVLREKLIEARLGGVRRIKDQNGEEIEYKTDAEMAKAIAYADSLLSRSKPNTIHFNTSKGV